MNESQTSEHLLDQAIRAHRRALEPSVERLEAYRQAVSSLEGARAPSAVTALAVYAKGFALAALVASLGYGMYTTAQGIEWHSPFTPAHTGAPPRQPVVQNALLDRPHESHWSATPTQPAKPLAPQDPTNPAPARSPNLSASPSQTEGSSTRASSFPAAKARRSKQLGNSATRTGSRANDAVDPVRRLVQVDWALRSGDPEKAQKLLSEWTPSSRHEKTAAALEILIGCGLGENVIAKRRRFASSWPQSSFDQRIVQECPPLHADGRASISKNKL